MKPARPRKTWVFVLIGAVLGGSLLTGSAYLISKAVLEMSAGGTRLTEICATRLSQVAKAQLLYAADHDETLPGASNWIDATWPYGEQRGPKGKKLDPADMNESIFRCPVVSAERAGGYGYGFNRILSDKKLAECPKDSGLVFDIQSKERNAFGDPTSDLPSPGRHANGMTNVVATVGGNVLLLPSSK